jgi:gluconokinase
MSQPPTLDHALTRPVVIVLMGVSGSGKTTVGVLLAAALGYAFQEGDDLHPPANVAKMRAGHPLDDADRMPWLHSIAAVIDGWRARGVGGVVASSALKRRYRDILIGERAGVVLVYLKGTHELIARRVAARHHRYMPAALLGSQFSTLEEPAPDEHPLVVDVSGTPAEIADRIVAELRARERGS